MPPAAPQDQYDQLKAAVLGATANTAAPLGNMPEISKLYDVGSRLDTAKLASAGTDYNAGVQADYQKEQAKLAKDPSKYQALRKQDGGYDFYDPLGNQIDITTYAQATNQRPADIVKDSDNPIDIQYTNDHKNLTDFISAIQSGDTDTVNAMKKAQPALAKYTHTGGIDKLIGDFKNYYKRYYVSREQDKNAWGAKPKSNVFVPNAQVATSQYDQTYGGDAGIGG